MTRSPIALAIIAVLCVWALYGAGVFSWTPTPWEAQAAQQVAKDAGRAAKTIGVKVNIPPKPPGIAPAPKASARSTTTLYPVGNGEAIPAPPASPSITSAYCQLEQVSTATCQQAEAQGAP